MESIENKIAELVEYVNTTYQKNEMFFADLQKSEESKIQAEKIIENTGDDKSEIIINVKSSKEIDEIIYYLISILLGDDLASVLNMVYLNPEKGIVIFSNFQDVVAKIYEMNVAFNGNKFNTKK